MSNESYMTDEEKAKLIERISKLGELTPESVVKVVATKPSFKDFFLPFVVALAVLSSTMACFTVWRFKENQVDQPEIKTPAPVTPSVIKVDDGRIDKIEAKLDILGTRVRILAFANNENAWLSRDNDKDDRYLYVSGDWKLSGVPQHIDFSEADKQFLIKAVKN